MKKILGFILTSSQNTRSRQDGTAGMNPHTYAHLILRGKVWGLIAVFLSVLFLDGLTVRATDFSSSGFKVRDPVMGGGGGYATSTNYQLWSAFSEPAIGVSTSSSNEIRSGFLYFLDVTPTPEATPSPTPTPSPGTGSGSVTTPFSPEPLPSPLPTPTPPLKLPPLLAFITGEPVPLECLGVRRSDLNCDGKVNLQDLSILFSRSKAITGRTLSLLFFDWTRPLPVPLSKPERTTGLAGKPGLKTSPRPLAQVSELIEGTASEPAKPRLSFLRAALQFLKLVARFFARLLGFSF